MPRLVPARPSPSSSFDQRFEDAGDMPAEELLEPGLDGFAIGSCELIVGYDRYARLEQRWSRFQARR